ncbi:hypothetical protein [Hymenobacter weizhouensis]|uniref:hypothetical protein n=1 Tax=Hymenobacter sp. YIM 151500-1 TaxID=2987689 RepID=UPI002227E6AD|nr:hypothetical protein [Hymenobacter sp. YIM 151500-1]UYZ62771.1 hypothetical protein OIS53_17460 [Hymenobacter sp. YIM 151500-1]
MKTFRLVLLLLALPCAAWAQQLEWVRNPQYRLQYQVPSNWQQVRQATDTTLALTHLSPDQSLLLYIGKLQGAAARMTPAQALFHLTEQFGVPVNKQYATSYNGIKFLETTGMGTLQGRALRYDAMAATHQGHVLLIYVSAPPDAFFTHEALLTSILHSMAPYRGR